MLPRGNCRLGLSAMIFLGMLVFVMEVKPEERCFSRAGDLERKFCAGSVLLKERIDRLQQNGLPARRHLRQLRIQSQHAVKIKSISIKAVFSRHVRMRSRNQKMQVGERENLLVQREPPH